MLHMTLQQVIFYVFAGLTVLAAVMVVAQSNPVRCVLYLVLCFFSSSVLWILVHAEFLALILVLVYVGAVMTLFLFVVMMLNIDLETMQTHVWRRLPLGIVIVAALVALLYAALPAQGIHSSSIANLSGKLSSLSDTQAIGMLLYTDYMLAFELAAALLLVAIVAAITLAHRVPTEGKRQSIRDQIMVRSTDRLTLESLQSLQPKE